MGRTIHFYKTFSGRCPIKEFLDSFESKPAQKVTWVLKLIEELEIIPKNILRSLRKIFGSVEFDWVMIIIVSYVLSMIHL